MKIATALALVAMGLPGLGSARAQQGAAAGVEATGEQIAAFLTQGNVQYSDARTARVTTFRYLADGSARQFHQDGTIAKGTWRVAANRFCASWPPRPAETCSTLRKISENRYAAMEGATVSGYFFR